MIRLIARSTWFLAASWIPTTFSTAFPARATTTSPAKASEIPSEPSDGSSASTNQSETRAAPPADAASRPIANGNGQTRSTGASSALAPGPPAIENGIERRTGRAGRWR